MKLFSCNDVIYLLKIPASLGDRYAHIDHGFGYHSDSNATSCMDYSHMSTKPIECQEGSDDAQAAAAWSNFGLNLLTLIFCPVVGAASDFHGRRPCILLGLSLSCIPAVMYLVVLLVPTLDPVWYYVSLFESVPWDFANRTIATIFRSSRVYDTNPICFSDAICTHNFTFNLRHRTLYLEL